MNYELISLARQELWAVVAKDSRVALVTAWIFETTRLFTEEESSEFGFIKIWNVGIATEATLVERAPVADSNGT